MKKTVKRMATVGLVCMGLSICACGNKDVKNTDVNTSASASAGSSNQSNKEKTDKQSILGEQYYMPATGIELRFPDARKYGLRKNSLGMTSYNDERGEAVSDMYIYSYGWDGIGKPASTLEECVGSCDEQINYYIRNTNIEKYELTDKHVITEQKKVTVNGKEMLKVYGYINRSKDGGQKTGIVGYYMIVNADSINGGKENQPVYWMGCYEKESDKQKVENCVDAMAETVKLID